MDNMRSDSVKGIAEDDDVFYCKVLLAEKKIEIESKFKRTLAFFRGYLSQFDQPDYVIRASEEDIHKELVQSYGEHITEKEQSGDKIIETLNAETNVICRKIADRLLECGIILMHGAAIAVDNKCYIFTAPSGTGKTTHINNWLKIIPDTIVVNGDKPLINVETGLVYGTPWSGKEQMNTNTSVPLAGIISLGRGISNSIVPVTFKEMLPVLLQQTYMPQGTAQRIRVYQHLGKLSHIAFYNLKCNMDPESAMISYQGICDYERKRNG